MIIGKNAGKKGFMWFGKLCIKSLAVAALLSFGVWGIIIGVIATGIFAYEVLKEWKELSKKEAIVYKAPEYDTKDGSDGYYGDEQKPDEK